MLCFDWMNLAHDVALMYGKDLLYHLCHEEPAKARNALSRGLWVP